MPSWPRRTRCCTASGTPGAAPRAAPAEHRGDAEEAVRLLDAATQEYARSRECEIAELVMEGLSDQASAARLHLGRRTAETHPSAVCRKSGIPSRSAPASFMTRAARGTSG
jgi:DNA-binding NarL/FixJ family response regulator